MTNAELIKALRYCSEASNEMGCSECTVDRTVDCVGKLMRDAADAIEKLTDEVDRKDKAIQAFLMQIEQMITERKKLRDTLIESICVNCDTPPDVRLRVCGECPIISPIREVFDE